jgi:threonine synthase
MLPVFMRHSAGNRGVMVLAATSGDTGSAAMEGFADVEGTKVTVLFPETGTSLVQRLQMTTCAASNVKAIAVKGNFDDAQAAVKRIFADKAMNEYASSRSLYLSSANSINTGRLIPQIGYYVMTGSRLGGKMFDVVVPSGNFGNILAAYYAKMMGVNIRKFVCASNVNDVLARFVATGVYEPGEKFFVTNSPSMDIRKSSNVERLLWLLNGGAEGDVEKACFETNRLMEDFNSTGRYELSSEAKEGLFAQFSGGYATEEETEEEMRLMRNDCGYLLDPHTAVGVSVAKKLSLPESGIECVIAATATPYKFPETCRHAFGEDVLSDPPESFKDLLTRPVVQNMTVEKEFIDEKVKETM